MAFLAFSIFFFCFSSFSFFSSNFFFFSSRRSFSFWSFSAFFLAFSRLSPANLVTEDLASPMALFILPPSLVASVTILDCLTSSILEEIPSLIAVKSSVGHCACAGEDRDMSNDNPNRVISF